MNQRKNLEEKLIEKALKDNDFKQRLISDPREVLKEEFNISIPSSINLNVIEEKENEITLVIPNDGFSKSEELNPEELDLISGGGDWDTNGTGHPMACG